MAGFQIPIIAALYFGSPKYGPEFFTDAIILNDQITNFAWAFGPALGSFAIFGTVSTLLQKNANGITSQLNAWRISQREMTHRKVHANMRESAQARAALAKANYRASLDSVFPFKAVNFTRESWKKYYRTQRLKNSKMATTAG